MRVAVISRGLDVEFVAFVCGDRSGDARRFSASSGRTPDDLCLRFRQSNRHVPSRIWLWANSDQTSAQSGRIPCTIASGAIP